MTERSGDTARRGSIWEYELTIHPADLKIGHFVRRMNIPWTDTHFLLQGVLVDSDETLQWFQEHCDWVVIDLKAGNTDWRPSIYLRFSPDAMNQAGEAAQIDVLGEARLDQDTITSAIRTYRQLDEQAEQLLATVADSGRIEVKEAEQVISEFSGQLDQNLAALVWLSRIKQKDRYTAQHCINVAILAMGLSASLGWPKEQIEWAGLAGLLHDIGKMQLDIKVLNKPGRLSPVEFEHVKRHPTLGYQMLLAETPLPDAVTAAVLSHHERPDGRGYPEGLTEAQIAPLTRMISVVDAYDAITSHRVYDAARSHHEALGILWKNRGSQFDSRMVEALTRFLGWVTPGTLVRLTNGRLAIVMETPARRGFLPLVRLLEQVEEGYSPGSELDLAAQREAGVRWPVRIAEVLPDGHAGIDIRQLTARLSF